MNRDAFSLSASRNLMEILNKTDRPIVKFKARIIHVAHWRKSIRGKSLCECLSEYIFTGNFCEI